MTFERTKLLKLARDNPSMAPAISQLLGTRVASAVQALVDLEHDTFVLRANGETLKVKPTRWYKGDPLIQRRPDLTEILTQIWLEWASNNRLDEDPLSSASGHVPSARDNLRPDTHPVKIFLSSKDWQDLSDFVNGSVLGGRWAFLKDNGAK